MSSLQTIAEFNEFAGFSRREQVFIETGLDLVLDRPVTPKGKTRRGLSSARKAGAQCPQTSQRYLAYRELRLLRPQIEVGQPIAAIGPFFGTMVRISGQDLIQGGLLSYRAYRFFYERLVGARMRPYMVSAFCAAAALPQIDPDMRTILLASLQEDDVAIGQWSQTEPIFMPTAGAASPTGSATEADAGADEASRVKRRDQ